ncbi:MAG: radical SAM protein [Candidatus Sumerlaeaceae bacterium]
MTPRRTLLSKNSWEDRLEILKTLAETCRLCPRECGARRLQTERGECGAGRDISLVSYGPHHGEESCLSGWQGSGTLFFGHCNLHCIYCQNADISQNHLLAQRCETTPDVVASAMLALQTLGCHNINCVSPTHQLYGIVQACQLATEQGLWLPLVYNTHSYDSLEALKAIAGIVDIYLPDLKYANSRVAERLGAPADYPGRARAAITEMYRQVGGLRLDERGLAVQGVLVRLLVLPNNLSGTIESLEWLRSTLGTDVGVNIMAQYHPAYCTYLEPQLQRRLYAEEYVPIVEKAFQLGFKYVVFDKSLTSIRS